MASCTRVRCRPSSRGPASSHATASPRWPTDRLQLNGCLPRRWWKPSVKPSRKLRWFDSNLCHHLRKPVVIIRPLEFDGLGLGQAVAQSAITLAAGRRSLAGQLVDLIRIDGVTAASLASRIGLRNTMVFTHLPSNLLVAAIPLGTDIQIAGTSDRVCASTDDNAAGRDAGSREPDRCCSVAS